MEFNILGLNFLVPLFIFLNKLNKIILMKLLRQQLEDRIEVRNIMEYNPRNIIKYDRYEMPDEYSFITLEEFCELNGIPEEELTDNQINYFYEHYGERSRLPMCRYHMDHDHNDWIVENLQSAQTENATEFVKKQRYVYHITHKDNIQNILKKGLRPKVKKNNDEDRYRYYTERIFLIVDSENIKSDITQVINDLNLWRDYAILKIDISKLNITYWWDDASRGNTVYTVESIHPKFIEVIDNINNI